MKKLVCIVNGKGGAGKDTVCAFAAQEFRAQNISSITPILEVAMCAGWDGVKTKPARRFLSRLKEVCAEFNDLSFCYCKKQYQLFLQSDDEILLMHIREPEEIARMKQEIDISCLTLLIRRDSIDTLFGNRSDDFVERYQYDYIIENNSTLEVLKQTTLVLLHNCIGK